jgi:UDP-N-acetylglucosamine 3-dehydrogenase
MNRTKIGVIGLGRFGVQHARVLAQLLHVELTAVCSRSAERAGSVASTYNVPRHYTDYRDLMRDPDVDGVDIVTEVGRHTEIALAALRRRKHVFSEILLTDSLDENDRLIDEAEKSGVVFMVGFLERFDVRRGNIKQKIDAGDLGELVSIYGRRNIWRGILDAPRFKPYPLVLQPGIHTIDQLLWMAGEEVREVYTRTRSMTEPDRPDTWWAMLTFQSGLVGVIEQSFFMPDRRLYWSDAGLEVVGTDGTAHIVEPNDASWIWTGEATSSPDLYLAPELHGRIVGAMEQELTHFADCVIEHRNPAHGTLQDARNALRVGLAIVESARTKQAVHL